MKFRAFFTVLAIVLLWPLLTWLDSWLNPPPEIKPHPDHDVVLFTSQPCRSCDRARELLQEHQVVFHEYDVRNSEEALQKFEALGGLGVPLAVIRGQVIRGFNETALRQALQSAD